MSYEKESLRGIASRPHRYAARLCSNEETDVLATLHYNRRDKARNKVSHSSSTRSQWTCKSGGVGHTSHNLPLYFPPVLLTSCLLCCSFAPLPLCFLGCFQTTSDRSIDQSWYEVIRILTHPSILHKYFHEVIDPWMDQWFNVQWIHRSWSDESMNE